MSRENFRLERDLETCDLVFVYGSLKRDNWNNRLLQTYSASFVMEGVTEDTFVLGDVGFPYAFPSEEVGELLPEEYHLRVEGEVFQVPNSFCLSDLDALEGEGWHYHRELRQLTSGETVWMYVQRDSSLLTRCYICDKTEEGNWKWQHTATH